MIVFQMINPDRPTTRVDIFVREPFDFDDVYAHAKMEPLFGAMAPIVPLRELIRMKREAGRDKDLGDIGELKHLLEIQDHETDR